MLTKLECKTLIGATLSGLVSSFGIDLVKHNALAAFYTFRSTVRNTDVPPAMPQLFDYGSSVLVVQVIGALARGLTQLTEADTVVAALGEIAQDEVYWKLCDAAIKKKREQIDSLRAAGLTTQEVVDQIRKDIEAQGGIGPFDRVDTGEGEDWKGI